MVVQLLGIRAEPRPRIVGEQLGVLLGEPARQHPPGALDLDLDGGTRPPSEGPEHLRRGI